MTEKTFSRIFDWHGDFQGNFTEITLSKEILRKWRFLRNICWNNIFQANLVGLEMRFFLGNFTEITVFKKIWLKWHFSRKFDWNEDFYRKFHWYHGFPGNSTEFTILKEILKKSKGFVYVSRTFLLIWRFSRLLKFCFKRTFYWSDNSQENFTEMTFSEEILLKWRFSNKFD